VMASRAAVSVKPRTPLTIPAGLGARPRPKSTDSAIHDSPLRQYKTRRVRTHLATMLSLDKPPAHLRQGSGPSSSHLDSG
jgi:hypothetical protein